MTSADFIALLPLLILAASPLFVMLAIMVRRGPASPAISFASLAAAFASLWIAAGVAPRPVTPILIIDRYALFYIGIIVAVTAGCVLLSWGYFRNDAEHPDELYVLLLIAALGSAVLASSSHFASFFLGLEILSVSLYGLIAYERDIEPSIEAGVKYLVLAASSASFLLFGMALVYFELGTMSFAQIANASGPLVTIGFVLILVGVGFKLALVPFHMWTPDIYQGAPAPVAAFVATVSKTAVFAVLLRYYMSAAAGRAPFVILSAIAIASMLAGNLLALRQDNVKRILAYSSIAHLGYILVALLAGGSMGDRAVTFYLIAYSFTTLGAFAVVAVVSRIEREADHVEDYRGLFWRHPIVSGILTIMMLSLAGLPVTAGFIAKFYLVAAGADQNLWLLITILIAGSAIGLFYYLRVVVAMYSPAPTQETPLAPHFAERIVLAALALIVIWLGIYPAPVLNAIAQVF